MTRIDVTQGLFKMLSFEGLTLSTRLRKLSSGTSGTRSSSYKRAELRWISWSKRTHLRKDHIHFFRDPTLRANTTLQHFNRLGDVCLHLEAIVPAVQKNKEYAGFIPSHVCDMVRRNLTVPRTFLNLRYELKTVERRNGGYLLCDLGVYHESVIR